MRMGILALLPLLAFTRPGFENHALLVSLLQPVGAMILIGALFGRLWSMTYLGDRQNRVVVNDGPYSICRHPIYMFSVLLVFGAGMMLGSIVLTLIFTYLAYRMLSAAAEREERYLVEEFGETYRYYYRHTPGWFPQVTTLQFNPAVSVKLSGLKSGLLDAGVLLMLIPLSQMFETLQTARNLPTFPIF